MPWTPGPVGGFTAPGVEPWLPVGDLAVTVEGQRADPGSVLHLCRDLIALRRERGELATGAWAPIQTEGPVWAWRRGGRTLDRGEPVRRARGGRTSPTARSCSRRAANATASASAGRLPLDPWDALVVADGIVTDDPAATVPAALLVHPHVVGVELVGSRAAGTAGPLSD